MKDYKFTEIETKWRNYWSANKTYKVVEDGGYPKDKRLYILDMFPYPSGDGLHVGHPEGYTATDIYSRFKKMNGFNVLHPMGYDAFGLPAENYAIKTQTHPAETTRKNIEKFTRQIQSLGFCYDWDRKIETCSDDYYKWTQWIFLKIYKKGLAYESDMPINWCPSCKTGLANEEVNSGKCERCETEITRKRVRQWVLKITEYAERLLTDLDLLDWSSSIKEMQKNWIGKSTGAEVDFKIYGIDETLQVYTTRPDTLFGATYIVVAPEHSIVDKVTSEDNRAQVNDYIKKAGQKTDLQRTDLNKDKTGVFTGGYAINPIKNQKIPIWISDYVLLSYGTGAIMAVPGHDERDFEFATKYNLPIIQVVSRDGSLHQLKEAYTGNGIAVNSMEFDGLKTKDMQHQIIAWLIQHDKGRKCVNYKLRDWIFSRQRYWGEPIPLIHCESCGIVPLEEADLPIILPDVESYQPTSTGESPLAAIDSWVNTSCHKCGNPAKRETNTMPQWAGSCWYYLRFIDPKNDQAFASKDKLSYWGPVNLYIGGAEHAVLHLLYSRFWHKVLYDLGFIEWPEPFMALRNQGMILGESGEKMSKSKGNVINPDDIIHEHGADTLRMYEMFMGPLAADKPWNMQGISGVKRFLDKSWRLFERADSSSNTAWDVDVLMHKTIKIVTEKIENLEFNTAISQLMIFVNLLQKQDHIHPSVLENLTLLLHPFAPYITEELWEILGHKPSIIQQYWPSYDADKVEDEMVTIVFQVNSKIRGRKDLPKGLLKESIVEEAYAIENVKSYTEGKEVVKEIVVPDKLVNIIVK
jgi:leucyl-tRNA synthetase